MRRYKWLIFIIIFAFLMILSNPVKAEYYLIWKEPYTYHVFPCHHSHLKVNHHKVHHKKHKLHSHPVVHHKIIHHHPRSACMDCGGCHQCTYRHCCARIPLPCSYEFKRACSSLREDGSRILYESYYDIDQATGDDDASAYPGLNIDNY